MATPMSSFSRASVICVGIFACIACEPQHRPAAPTTPAPTPAHDAPAAPSASAAASAAPAPSTPVTRAPPKTLDSYVRVATPRVVLSHVRVIDGTGHAAVDDRNVVLDHGKITAIEAGADVAASDGTTVLALRGYSVIPGLVGMHDHLFYIARPNFDEEWQSELPIVLPEMLFSAPRLYLAAGVTTMRTTGSIEPYTDLNIRDAIEM